MKKFINPYIKCIIFIVGLAVVVALSDFLFAQTGYINYILRQADSKSNDYNVFILGASHARCAIDPAAIEKKSDDTVLNMAIPGETIKDSYYLIQELNRTNDIDKIVLDIDYNYWYGNLGEGCFAEPFLYNQYSWTSPIKWKYLIENTDMMDFRNAFTKKFVYQYKLDNIKENIKQKTSKDYKDANIYSLDTSDAGDPYTGKGFFALPLPLGNPVGEEYVKGQIGVEKQDINPYPEKYFRKLVKYCNSHNIDLVCITSPITPSSMKRLGIDEAYRKLKNVFDELGIRYYDFNEIKTEILPRKDTDYIDKEGHMGGELAYRYSDILAEVLNKDENGTLNTSDYFYDTYEQMYEAIGE